ncbi:MAG: [FeFe] hydrogenase H-cluster radical SAM maturase HydG [Rikenellaceae bacterium]|nr:[FeFe] hydrogenase H-cluster radical SAM maturase HydG [Rikenellaceae bacterium]
MIFNPQKYSIEDIPNHPFIDKNEILSILNRNENTSVSAVRDIISKSMCGHRLSMYDAAALIKSDSEECTDLILDSAKEIKRQIYGNRMVIFAPLYVGNSCINNCAYCGFRSSNTEIIRRTLTNDELSSEVGSLIEAGHKRLILVYGEHPKYDAEFIAESVRRVYGISHSQGDIRRVNINAAPFDTNSFRTIKSAGIGTYQIFQETYDPDSYRKYHLGGKKSDYNYRLTALNRAMEAGIDDVGIGALLGLYDWRFELLSMIRHANHLEACYNVGPHTVSFPRIKNASNVETRYDWGVGDKDFIRFIAILRLAIPYAGLILTAREPSELRDSILDYGITQIDGGTNLEIGGYSSERKSQQDLNREQFRLNDERPLKEVVKYLVKSGQVPSFCTACYRKGRTGEDFMKLSTTGEIKNYCAVNSLLTFAEYLEDFTDTGLYARGWDLINRERGNFVLEQRFRVILESGIDKIKKGERNICL